MRSSIQKLGAVTGLGLRSRGEVQPGSARVARGDQTFRPSAGAEKEPDLVRFRLHDLVGARAAKARVEFVCKRAERKVVTAHGYIITRPAPVRNAKIYCVS